MRRFLNIAAGMIVGFLMATTAFADNYDYRTFGPWMVQNAGLDVGGGNILSVDEWGPRFNSLAQYRHADGPGFMLNATWRGGVYGASRTDGGAWRRQQGSVAINFSQASGGALSFDADFSGIPNLPDMSGTVNSRGVYVGNIWNNEAGRYEDNFKDHFTFTGDKWQYEDNVAFNFNDDDGTFTGTGTDKSITAIMDGAFYHNGATAAGDVWSWTRESGFDGNGDWFDASHEFSGVFSTSK